VIMRVTPEVSSTVPQLINLGNGNFGTAFNVQSMDTTVACADGETIVIGGLITKQDARSENKVPILGDLPGVGALFRYRQRQEHRKELIFILTPQIVYAQSDFDRLTAQETSRMAWNLGDIGAIHQHGMEKFGQPSTPACPKYPTAQSPAIPGMPLPVDSGVP